MNRYFSFSAHAGYFSLTMFVLLSCTGSIYGQDVIRSPISVINSGFTESIPSTYPLANLINQSGLSQPFASGVDFFDTYNGTHEVNGDFLSTPDFPNSIDFDLGDTFEVRRMALWGDAQPAASDRSVNNFELLIDDNPSFTSATSAGIFNAAGFEADPSTMQVFDVTDLTGRYVRMTVNSHHGSSSWFQFGEVAFATDIPEPASLITLGCGVALCLLGRRMKKSASSDCLGCQV